MHVFIILIELALIGKSSRSRPNVLARRQPAQTAAFAEIRTPGTAAGTTGSGLTG